MRILFATSELYPYAKTGGLGDVAAALPPALKALGLDLRVILPGYPAVLKALEKPEVVAEFSVYFGAPDFKVLFGTLPGGISAYVLDCPHFFGRSGIYVDGTGRDYTDNHLRFAALSRAAADIGDIHAAWAPDVIHGNDWQTGLIPVYLRAKNSGIKTVFTIHNIAYQGLFQPDIMTSIGMPLDAFNPGGAEFYNKVGYLKAGLAYSDRITTVSPTYATEIQSGEQGCGLDGFLRTRARHIIGILNGIDTGVWNPETDPLIARNYTASKLDGKKENKRALLGQFKLTDENAPLFGAVSRLGYQKGFDLLLEALPYLLQKGGNLVLLGSGDPAQEKSFQDIAAANPGRIGLHIGYDEQLAHKIIAGSDVIMMPSRSEPCGLVQLYAMRYGTLPFVHGIGGLADTVTDTMDGTDNTGFVFHAPDSGELIRRLDGVLNDWQETKTWKNLQANSMSRQFSWESSAQKYMSLYNSLI